MRFGRTMALVLLASASLMPAARAAEPGMARWRVEAARVSITRDDWGIAHIHGVSDADAVFGMIYAQAEDDFPRIEGELPHPRSAAPPRPMAKARSGPICASGSMPIRRR